MAPSAGEARAAPALLLCVLFTTVSCGRREEREVVETAEPGALFPVVKDGKWGYIDKEGDYVWKPTK